MSTPRDTKQSAAAPRTGEPRNTPTSPVERPSNEANPHRAPGRPADHQWREHEHEAPAAQAHAQNLLKETGSPELAKHAVEEADAHAVSHPDAAGHDAAARDLGFESFSALERDATPLPVERGRTLMICPLRDGRWIRFNPEDWPTYELFATRDEAMLEPAANTHTTTIDDETSPD